jgi:hypothetical protein
MREGSHHNCMNSEDGFSSEQLVEAPPPPTQRVGSNSCPRKNWLLPPKWCSSSGGLIPLFKLPVCRGPEKVEFPGSNLLPMKTTKRGLEMALFFIFFS